MKKYGEKGKNGVVEIITKKDSNIQLDTIPDKVFTKVENEPEFPGGQEAWLKYIQTVIQKNADLLITDHNEGTCLLEFIVNVNGNVSDVTATTMKNSRLAEVSVNAIKEGPKWKPAIQNGHIVASYKKLPVTFKIIDNIVDHKEPE
jgi:periplasmic protein TonB